jgi:pimeloyl-ACP methyl ester carboxylesterase
MKYYLKITSALLAILLLGSCQKDYDSDDTQEAESHAKEWYQIIKIDTLAFSDIVNSISGANISLSLGIDLVRASFLYQSKANETIDTLSGCVCWPVRTATCSNILLENHYTSSRWDECPSQTPMPGMLKCSMLRAIYIGPDYQGLGLSRNLPQPYFNTVLLADQSIDCFKAALSILNEWGPTLSDDYSTRNVGYSLGGAVSLGVARRAELDPEVRKIMHLQKSYCGAGPYDQVAMMDLFLSQPDKVLDLALSLPFAIKSILFSSPSLSAKYSESDFFTQGLLDSGILEKMDTRDYDTGQLNRMLYDGGFNTPNTILSADLLQDETPIAIEFRQELDKLNLTTGWTPTIPILFYHSKADEVVPIVCLECIKTNMADNSNITYKVVDSGEHGNSGVSFYLEVI